MYPLLETLLSQSPVITDGAWGTQLQERGLPVGACADEWNLSHPDRVEEVARAYVDAGSRVILTNTFRANRLALASLQLTDRARDINRAGVEISRRAAAGQALVYASIGPSGKRLDRGEVNEETLHAVFTEQADVLAQAGADALVLETMTDLREAEIAMSAARETGLPVVACMVFGGGGKQDRTMSGETPEQVAATLAKADVLGANCGAGMIGYLAVCQRLRAATHRPLWMKPSAGLPQVIDGKFVYPTAAEEFADFGLALVAAGASFIGGCCGTSPDHVQALRTRLHK